MFRVKEVEDSLNEPIQYQTKEIQKLIAENPTDLTNEDRFLNLILYNLNSTGAVFTDNNDLKIFTDGKEKFHDLIEEMKTATKYIHFQYYIIRDDELFREIAKVLKQKAKEGVEVRVLGDGMGCRSLSKKVIDDLRNSGVKVSIFFPALLKWFHLRMNYRNHRKIVVIDGRVGYVGGFNVGKEYLSEDKYFGHWRDTHLKIWGPSIMGLQIRFALDWNFASKENLFLNKKYFEETIPPDSLNSKCLQVIASGPDYSTPVIRDTYLQLIHSARDHIYIQTPYFIPDDAILSALKIAASSGVDVRLMIPCKPDHPFVYWATYSYAGDLIKAGGKCYTYENGFLHAKGICCDSLVCCYGTANMDIRSFKLNFEVNALVYDEDTTLEMERIFREDISKCKELKEELYDNRGYKIRFKEQISRLLSPLL
ncbi:Cardiolipin synthetase [Lachnospiraceae bacterium TWA4]|nr:Cardiolipin synthetase [Lachnospiraceae bacterium TWA4]